MPHLPIRTVQDLLTHNERSANRLIGWILLMNAIFLGVVLAEYISHTIELGYHYVVVITTISFFIQIAVAIFILLSGHHRHWHKWFVILTMIVTGETIFFIFPSNAKLLIMLPIIVSIRYYRKKYTLYVALACYISYLITCILNVELDTIVRDIYLQHRLNGLPEWHNYYDVFWYEITNRTWGFLFVTFLAVNIVRNGSKLGMARLKMENRVSRLNTELAVGAHIQQSLLPKADYTTPGELFTLYTVMKPAEEVAGDFYDYFMIDQMHLVFLVADVSDKGLPAAMFMMSAKSEIRSAVNVSTQLAEAVEKANSRLLANNEVGMFVTMWIGVLNVCTGHLTYLNAGHLPALICHGDSTPQLIHDEHPNTFIGVFDNYHPHVGQLQLQPGDMLLLYTDGVTDCQNQHQTMYGRNQLIKTIQQASNHTNQLSPTHLCTKIMDSLTNFRGHTTQFDDITLLALQMAPQNLLNYNATYPAQQKSVSQLTQYLTTLLTAIQCPDHVRRHILTAVDEIATNIVEYAYPPNASPTPTFTVCYQITSHTFTLQIADSGKPFNPLQAPSPQFTQEPPLGGLGIHITTKLMDHVSYQYHNNQNHLTITKNW